jgi:anti-sigma regulatory factor (Ser/Thr protein kinase)
MQCELQLPPEVAYVWLARLVVATAARQSGMDQERVQDLKTAVSEAATNAIIAHGQLPRARPIVLHFGPEGERTFEVTVVDAGPGLDGVEAPSQVADEHWSSESGLGLTLIRGLADDVAFVREGGTRVHMRFSVGLDGDAPAS